MINELIIQIDTDVLASPVDNVDYETVKQMGCLDKQFALQQRKEWLQRMRDQERKELWNVHQRIYTFNKRKKKRECNETFKQ